MYKTTNTTWDLTRAYIGTVIMALMVTGEIFWGYTQFAKHAPIMATVFLIGVVIWRKSR